MKCHFLLLLGIYSSTLVEITGFCSRPYDYPAWESHTLEQRSKDADVIVYAEIINSPCYKPEPLTTTAQPPTTTAAILEKIGFGNLTINGSLSSNYTSTLWQTTAAPTTTAQTTTTAPPTTTTAPPNTTAPYNTTAELNTTAVPTTSHNCSFGSYNASLRIHCVIKGGKIPEYIHLEELGLGNETCVFRELNETEHDFHAYNGRNYTIFLKRKHNTPPKEDSFTIHTVNLQPATQEIANVDMLKPIFKVTGRHAHAATEVWVNKTDPVCKPYSGACSIRYSFVTAFSMSVITLSTYFLY